MKDWIKKDFYLRKGIPFEENEEENLSGGICDLWLNHDIHFRLDSWSIWVIGENAMNWLFS